jgi:hypothetical protein
MAAERGRSQNECRAYQAAAGAGLQPPPKASRLDFIDDALWLARGSGVKCATYFRYKLGGARRRGYFVFIRKTDFAKYAGCQEANIRLRENNGARRRYFFAQFVAAVLIRGRQSGNFLPAALRQPPPRSGIEIDNSAVDVTGHTTINGAFPSCAPYLIDFGTRISNIGTVRMRIGYASGRFLPYFQ